MICTVEKEMYQDIYDFVEDVVSEEKDANSYKSILSYFQQHLDAYTYLVKKEESIQSILAYDSQTFHIAFVLTKQQYRHQDYASSLLDVLKEKAQKSNIARITVDINEALVPFYIANGFEQYEKTSVFKYEYLLAKNMLGKTVTIIIDRPYGSLHPVLPDTTYLYNYGYVKEDMLEDKEFQDAYVVGIKQPIDTFTGYVAGIIYRQEENTSRWIVAPIGTIINHEDTIQLLGNEEQFYTTRWMWME